MRTLRGFDYERRDSYVFKRQQCGGHFVLNPCIEAKLLYKADDLLVRGMTFGGEI